MLVVEVYNKAEWEITGGADDAEGRTRKSVLLAWTCPVPGRLVNRLANYLLQSA